jgi:hypothetical protein
VSGDSAETTDPVKRTRQRTRSGKPVDPAAP